MTSRPTDNNTTGGQPEMNELMAAFNPEPPQPDEPARFYWQEPWRAGDTEAVQQAFES